MDSSESQEHNIDESSIEYKPPFWGFLPDSILLHLFKYLMAPELVRASRVCHTWYRVACDEFLWKDRMRSDFNIDTSVGLAPGRTSWMQEYCRLMNHTPLIETEVLKDHAHQVLHVSFSHNGRMFATCSKDGEIIVWNSNYPAKIKYSRDMKEFSWKYTQYSQFNSTDTLLLVSGVHFGTPHSTSGEIAVFSLQGGFELQCRMANKPYDIFGTWYNDRYLLSGDLYWLAHLVSTSVLWLNKASQESSSEHTAIMNQLFRFYNRNASSVRAIMVADCLAPPYVAPSTPPPSEVKEEEEKSGNPPSHHAQQSRQPPTLEELEVFARPCMLMKNTATLDMFKNIGVKKKSERQGLDYASPINYKEEYRLAEGENRNEAGDDSSSTSTANDGSGSAEGGSGIDSDDEEEDGEGEDNLLEHKDKFLIFTTGSKTFTPHQIGFKRIKPVAFPHRLDPGPSLKERLAERDRQNELERQHLIPGGPPRPPEPNWLDFESVSNRFDSVDHLIDLHGHIIGMGLSPDHRFLYVNSRPWPQDYNIRNPLDPPPIAQEIDIHVIDLVSLREVGTMLRSHKAYTPNNECFFIFLDVCDEYVASGAEDKHGYLWDRHYGTCLAKYPHDDVVNSVAFNPRDPEMLVTVSDDFTIKVWRSRRRTSALVPLGAPRPLGYELRRGAEFARTIPAPRNL